LGKSKFTPFIKEIVLKIIFRIFVSIEYYSITMNADITFHITNAKQMNALKAIGEALQVSFEIVQTEPSYNDEMLKKVTKGKKEIKEGKGIRLNAEDIDNLWK
jgi:hypothetical protein